MGKIETAHESIIIKEVRKWDIRKVYSMTKL